VEEESDKVVPPVSSEEKKKKEKNKGGRGLRAEAGWAGSGAARLGPRGWPSRAVLLFFYSGSFLFVFCFASYLFQNWSKLIQTNCKFSKKKST
jgi:hypothetical protein